MKCQHCGSDKITMYAQINQSGSKVITARCDQCGRIPEHGKPFYSVKDYDWASLPLLQNLALNSEPCQRCGAKEGTELHHYSPRHLFADSDEWATGYLCKKCHDEWHKTTKTGAYSKR